MYLFVGKLKEIRWTYNRIKAFEVLLNGIAIISASILLLTLLALPPVFGVLPALPYIFFKFYRHADMFSVLDRDENLKERIRAAYDNREKDSVVMHHLSSEAFMKLDKVIFSSFVEKRLVVTRVLLSILLAFASLAVILANVQLLDVRGELAKAAEKAEDFSLDKVELKKLVGNFLKPPKSEEEEKDVFGKPSVAELPGQKLKLDLYLGGGEINLREVKPMRETFAQTPELPLAAMPSATYEEDIPEKHEKVVRKYFEEVAKVSE